MVGRMRSLLKRAPSRPLDVPAMCKVDSRPEAVDDLQEIVVRICGEGSRAKSDAIGGVIDDADHALERRSAGNNPRQPEYRPRRIVGMESHHRTGDRGDRDHALEKVCEALAQPLAAESPVRVQ